MVRKIYKVVFSQDAQKKLRKISDYHKENTSASVAQKIRDGLLSEAKSLKTLPNSKPLLLSQKKTKPPYRYTRKWSFKIIFQVFRKESTVSVVEIIHDKESPTKWENL